MSSEKKAVSNKAIRTAEPKVTNADLFSAELALCCKSTTANDIDVPNTPKGVFRIVNPSWNRLPPLPAAPCVAAACYLYNNTWQVTYSALDSSNNLHIVTEKLSAKPEVSQTSTGYVAINLEDNGCLAVAYKFSYLGTCCYTNAIEEVLHCEPEAYASTEKRAWMTCPYNCVFESTNPLFDPTRYNNGIRSCVKTVALRAAAQFGMWGWHTVIYEKGYSVSAGVPKSYNNVQVDTSHIIAWNKQTWAHNHSATTRAFNRAPRFEDTVKTQSHSMALPVLIAAVASEKNMSMASGTHMSLKSLCLEYAAHHFGQVPISVWSANTEIIHDLIGECARVVQDPCAPEDVRESAKKGILTLPTELFSTAADALALKATKPTSHSSCDRKNSSSNDDDLEQQPAVSSFVMVDSVEEAKYKNASKEGAASNSAFGPVSTAQAAKEAESRAIAGVDLKSIIGEPECPWFSYYDRLMLGVKVAEEAAAVSKSVDGIQFTFVTDTHQSDNSANDGSESKDDKLEKTNTNTF